MSTRQVVNLGSVEISYVTSCVGKEPLLLLHGLADHCLVWSNLIDYLTDDYYIIAPDLRGHGDSSKPQQGYRFQDYLQDLEGLMDHLGLANAHVLGHSWSAKLAAIWATQKPERFRSLILVDPFFIDKMPSWFKLTFPILYKVLPFLKVVGDFADYETAEQIARQLKQYQGWTKAQAAVFRQGITQKPDGTWASKFVVQARDEIFAEVMKTAGLTKPIDVPTLFIKPQQGLNRTSWQLRPYQTYITNLQITEVPGNHWPFLVEPVTFNQAIKEFLLKEYR